MRKITTILSALLLTAALSTTAFATDYATDPKYNVPTNEVATATSDAGKTLAKPAAVVTDSSITEALKATAPIVYVKATQAVVTKDTIAVLKAATKTVSFVSSGFTITIDPAKITAVKADLDLSLAMTKTTAETTVGTAKVPANAFVIDPAATGDFGLEMAITVTKAQLGTIDTAKAKLYYIGDDGKVTEMGKLTVNADGSVLVKITHASEYVIAETAPVAAATTATAATNPKTGNTASDAAMVVVTLLGITGIAFASKKLIAKRK